MAVVVEKSASGRFFRLCTLNVPVAGSCYGTRAASITIRAIRWPMPACGPAPGDRAAGLARHGVVRTLQRETNRMRFIVWLLRALVFVVLLILALANTQEASLNFVAGYAWQAPLILVGLVFFAVGLFAGVLAAAPALVRLRLENARLRRQIKNVQDAPVVFDEPPLPPII
jgi:putative membrane protein